jgi:SAM-dependent methyltransferase
MEGWHGWDDYAPFYDWENARTVGRRDVAFWRRLAEERGAPVLELGCGTGRVTLPVGRAVDGVVGIDRSGPMLGRARRRLRRAGLARRVCLIRGDIRSLPFRRQGPFRLVMAPYGVLQSLLRDRDLRETLDAVRSALRPGGTVAIDLVPELPRWGEYDRRVSLRGRRRGGAASIILIESVRQDQARRLTIFDQEFTERRGQESIVRRFELAFRTLSVRQMSARLRKAGFTIESVSGDYTGGAWHPEADTGLVVARRSG